MYDLTFRTFFLPLRVYWWIANQLSRYRSSPTVSEIVNAALVETFKAVLRHM